MREIKFRAWHTVQKVMYSAGEMASDQLTLLPTGCFINVHSDSTRLSQIIPNDVMIPLQFTGLLDKNGKEIYEGDIVEDHDTEYAGKGVVEWKDGALGFTYSKMFGHVFCRNTMEHFEVIGNIYENPELIEVTD